MSGLGNLLSALSEAGQLVQAPQNLPEITDITDDSRLVEPGSLFCAVEGTVQDGHAYLSDAGARGAVAALVTRSVQAGIPQIIVRDSRTATTIAAREWFGRPADALRLIGVTGTNGKTTTVSLIRHLLNAGGAAGAVGTVGAFDGAGEMLEGSGVLTTPGAVELQRALAELVSRGVTTVVMETSSHALDQRRLETLGFAAAVYTNLTHDHLDYHPDLDAYRDAKLLLSELLVEGGVEVVNRDEAAWLALPGRGELRRVWWGTGEDVDVRARDVSLEFTGARFTLEFGDEALPAALPLLGDFNVSNAVAAAATAWAVGEDAGAIVERLGSAPQIPGRMERLAHGEFVVLRDYAHTPDALERAIEALRPVAEGRLIVLFGAGGDRDRAKRPIMGGVAARGADIAVVTSDNPRTEDPDAIIDEIEAGMGEVEHVRIPDRREAIRHAVGMCRAGDILLLAGKGHETYQVVGTERHPFDEKTIVAEVVAEREDA